MSCYDQDGCMYNGKESSSIQKVEQSACLLQQQLVLSDSELIIWLAESTHSAIIAVVSAVDVNDLSRSANHNLEVEQHVAEAIVSVCNLQYASCCQESGPWNVFFIYSSFILLYYHGQLPNM